jgi:pimeloyl-ACP methyl ester carboxylesterase
MSTQIVERMAAEIAGSGDPVVLIHGLGGTSNVWTPVLPAFAARARVIRFDLPGSGRSPAGGPLSIQAFVDRIARAMRVLGAERAHVGGHSLGTIVAAHLAQQHPDLVRDLVLLGALPEPPEPARNGLKARAAKARAEGLAGIADQMSEASLSRDTREKNPLAVAYVRETIMRQDAEGYAATCEALSEARAADYARIGKKALLVTGEDDAIGTPAMSRDIASRLPESRAEILPRTGHWTPVERPAEAGRAMLQFWFGR